MESDATGLELKCTQEMEISSYFLTFLLKTGLKHNLMDNCLLAEESSLIPSQLSKDSLQSTQCGKMCDIWFLMLLAWDVTLGRDIEL